MNRLTEVFKIKEAPVDPAINPLLQAAIQCLKKNAHDMEEALKAACSGDQSELEHLAYSVQDRTDWADYQDNNGLKDAIIALVEKLVPEDQK